MRDRKRGYMKIRAGQSSGGGGSWNEATNMIYDTIAPGATKTYADCQNITYVAWDGFSSDRDKKGYINNNVHTNLTPNASSYGPVISYDDTTHVLSVYDYNSSTYNVIIVITYME
jgi:hypothetical protein